MQETWVHSLGWEDPLVEDMAAYSSILALRIPWTEEPGGLHNLPLGLRGKAGGRLEDLEGPGEKAAIHLPQRPTP